MVFTLLGKRNVIVMHGGFADNDIKVCYITFISISFITFYSLPLIPPLYADNDIKVCKFVCVYPVNTMIAL